MTDGQISEYVAANGMLLQPLESALASEIIHRNQINLDENQQESSSR